MLWFAFEVKRKKRDIEGDFGFLASSSWVDKGVGSFGTQWVGSTDPEDPEDPEVRCSCTSAQCP